MNHISTQTLRWQERMGTIGTLVPNPHSDLVLGLVQRVAGVKII